MHRGQQFVAGLDGGMGHLPRDAVADFAKHAHVRVHAQKRHHGRLKGVVGAALGLALNGKMRHPRHDVFHRVFNRDDLALPLRSQHGQQRRQCGGFARPRDTGNEHATPRRLGGFTQQLDLPRGVTQLVDLWQLGVTDLAGAQDADGHIKPTHTGVALVAQLQFLSMHLHGDHGGLGQACVESHL